ncbi:hypothetical protein GS506_04445 [Rhodococcus hoagii]|nr:hypothetical protein [Prescottella equi]
MVLPVRPALGDVRCSSTVEGTAGFQAVREIGEHGAQRYPARTSGVRVDFVY